MRPEFNKLYLLPLAVVILIIGGYYAFNMIRPLSRPAMSDGWQVFGDLPEDIEIAAAPVEQPAVLETPENIIIYITGEVNNPGVYELPPGSRAKDAVVAAGGTTENAALGAINLSLRISDEDHIIVPKIGEEVIQTIVSSESASDNSASNTSSSEATTRLININSASSTELQTLRGIGPVMAGRIIDHRERNGAFRNISELQNISGIGEKTFEAIADFISIE